ncbi:COR domain-containing protein [Gimesia sp.]|uniref:COR domain-containing protein n=1 Tax=Gimesia sp. TaxID=2024833 RepID=UPI003A8E54B6
MARNSSYYKAEKKIADARYTKSNHLDLSYPSYELGQGKLNELPVSLLKLPKLQELNLSFNDFKQLPKWLMQLKKLEVLNLAQNNFKSLPKWLDQLNELRELDISGNILTSFPKCLRKLTKLESINLNENQLKEIPDWIGELTNLRRIYLKKNELKDLPDSIVQINKKLLTLELSDNPLNNELGAAQKVGFSAIQEYLEAKAEEKITLNEAKLILIGEGEVGKTSLLGALRGDPWIEKRKTTHGVEVDIKTLTLTDDESGKKITFNGWDFGGQNIYRHTHQLFFTTPAIYLAVWNPRRGPEQCCVDEWIKMVKHRAYDESRQEERPRIFVVATHGGPKERLAHIDEQSLRDEFGDLIVSFHHVDSHKKNGLEELKKAIAKTAAEIPSVGRTVPANWKNVLDSLREMSEAQPYITFKQFQSTCNQLKVTNKLANTYAAILNELGHLIHYDGDAELRNTVILKPEWLSKAISYVLEDKQVKEQNGLVRHDRLKEIWNASDRPVRERYPDELHPVFLKLMERFDLSYRVVIPEEHAPKCSLVAQLVPGRRSEGWEQEWPKESEPGDTERTQVCRLVDAETGRTVRVEGLMYRLIVRLHRYSLGRNNFFNSRHWKTGMILDDGPNGRAFIEEVGGDIYIKVRAAYPERFLHLLCEEVRWLVEPFWIGLNCQFAVPCEPSCKGLLKLDEMIDYIKEGIDKVRCPVCAKFHLINDKLTTTAPRPDFFHAVKELKQGQEEIKLGMETGFKTVGTSLRRLISQADEQFAALMMTLTDPAKEGPRLFSFEPVDPNFLDKPKWIADKFRLTLWCEHSRLPLPVLTGDQRLGVYEIQISREWVRQSAPYLKVLSATLSLVLPIASSTTKYVMNETDDKTFAKQLDFVKTFAESFLDVGTHVSDWLVNNNDTNLEPAREIYAQGELLRKLHAILKDKDPYNSFGGLVCVQDKQYNYFWVHKQFADKYDLRVSLNHER